MIGVTQEGQVVWEFANLKLPYDAYRLPNDNPGPGRCTPISGAPGGRVIEVDEKGTVIWQHPPAKRSSSSSLLQERSIDITFNVHFTPVLDNCEVWRDRRDNLPWIQSFIEGSGINQIGLNSRCRASG